MPEACVAKRPFERFAPLGHRDAQVGVSAVHIVYARQIKAVPVPQQNGEKEK